MRNNRSRSRSGQAAPVTATRTGVLPWGLPVEGLELRRGLAKPDSRLPGVWKPGRSASPFGKSYILGIRHNHLKPPVRFRGQCRPWPSRPIPRRRPAASGRMARGDAPVQPAVPADQGADGAQPAGGVWRPGEIIPSELELAARFQRARARCARRSTRSPTRTCSCAGRQGHLRRHARRAAAVPIPAPAADDGGRAA